MFRSDNLVLMSIIPYFVARLLAPDSFTICDILSKQ